jgi:glutaredoxin-like protein NrdH
MHTPSIDRCIRNAYVQNRQKKIEEYMQRPVKIYTLSTCSHCKATNKVLDKCAVAYEFTDVDLLSGRELTMILEDGKNFNPLCTFPAVIIGDRVVIGFH